MICIAGCDDLRMNRAIRIVHSIFSSLFRCIVSTGLSQQPWTFNVFVVTARKLSYMDKDVLDPTRNFIKTVSHHYRSRSHRRIVWERTHLSTNESRVIVPLPVLYIFVASLPSLEIVHISAVFVSMFITAYTTLSSVRDQLILLARNRYVEPSRSMGRITRRDMSLVFRISSPALVHSAMRSPSGA